MNRKFKFIESGKLLFVPPPPKITPDLTRNSFGQKEFEDYLYTTWKYAFDNHEERNIDCRTLRGIGKTTVLKRIIREFKNLHPSRNTLLIVQTANFYNQYADLYYSGMLNRIITNDKRKLRGIINTYIFADEIPEVEETTDKNNCEFIAGFYSK